MEQQLQQILQTILNRPLKEVQPSSFSGEATEDILDWIDEFERASAHNNWNEQKVLTALPLYLKDGALVFYKGLPDDTKNNDVLLKETLVNYFNSPERQWQKKSKLFGLKQTGNLEAYIQEINKLTQQLQTPEDVKLDLFLNGLKDNLKRALRVRQPANFNDAVNYARLKNSVSKSKDDDMTHLMTTLLEKLTTHSSKEYPENQCSKLEQEMEILKCGGIQTNR